MSIEKRRTRIVRNVIHELFADGATSVRPGDVCQVLRERNMPLGGWEVRAEFSQLEQDAVIECDADTGNWRLTEKAALENTA